MLTSLFGPQFVRRSCGEHWIADMFGLLFLTSAGTFGCWKYCNVGRVRK